MYLLAATIICGLFLFVASFSLVRFFDQRSARLARIAYGSRQERDLRLKNFVGSAQSFLKALGKAVPRSPDDLSRQGRRLVQAGIRRRDGAVLLVGVQAGLVITLLSVSAAMGQLRAHPFAVFMICVFCGALLPDLWLTRKIAARKLRVQYGLPDALDLIVVCVEAGLGLDQSLLRIARELNTAYPDLSEELELVILEVNAGKSRPDALRNLSKRTDIEDIKALVAILIQTDRFGTSIGQSLRVFAQNLRVKRRQRAEEYAAKIPVKMVPAMVIFIFPAIFVVVAGPAVMRIAKSLLPYLGTP
jgi:tight adherence protein C